MPQVNPFIGNRDIFGKFSFIIIWAIAGSCAMWETQKKLFTPDQLYHLNKYIKDTSQSNEVLKKYTGIYYCPELDCKYGIVLKDHHLFLTNSKYNDAKLTLIGKDHLTDDNWWINHLMMKRDSKNNIIGFEVDSGRIIHLRFNKIE